eukprot:TRINITY_DN3787_c0_g1_i2.p2 TRINITY_DN3787_c0_g1~~TRINITY_DN3787_c0_g1_i2.p2  ORF type:complete len:235 (-),score=56.60 TRINITY_DN3787_c0_g1_i2:707-1354(-)
MPEGELYKQSAKRTEVRTKNIEAGKAVADAVRTSLGPRGMDKMVVQPDNEVIITNDGATILNKMMVQQPAAKMLVELSKSQDMVAGDGTTTVVVICGALLKKSLGLLGMGVHPTLISDSFQIASDRACQILTEIAEPVDISDRASLIQAAETSLCSKVVSQYSSIFAPLAVDAVFKVLDEEKPNVVDLRDIKVLTKIGKINLFLIILAFDLLQSL